LPADHAIETLNDHAQNHSQQPFFMYMEARKTFLLASTILLSLSSTTAVAADRHTAYNDPAEAGRDFQVQGEYIGEIQTDEGEVVWGGQIVARGDGKFVGVGYRGGLPAAGWDGSETVSAEGETKDGVLVHDDVEVPRATPSCIEEESPELGPVHLQNHGNPVSFRNIWLVEKK
jgi:hypothetical protein